MIRLYDTARREKVDLHPLVEGRVGVYVCGPTVYDMCHVGHARCYVAFDVVVRHLRARAHQVYFVRNVTDVDDKIIKRAAELGVDPLALSARFTDEFHADMAALGCVAPDVEPKVSEHILEITALIERIIAAGCAYPAGGDIYFEVDRFADYGALSRRHLDELRSGARVEVDERKRKPLDFALWKEAKPGEPSWPSPWGPGRPGWHIECSAMSSRYLGDSFDLHGGGMDLIFPHHENEIAQSRCITGSGAFAHHWMHNGFINVRTGKACPACGQPVEAAQRSCPRCGQEVEEKMSKSLGNFFTIRQVCERHEPEALRLFLLGTHYRSPISFEVETTAEGQPRWLNVEEAERRLAYAYTTRSRLEAALATGKPAAGPGQVLAPADRFLERLGAALDDDFNTAAALGQTSELLTLANKLLDQPKAEAKDVRRRTLEAVRDGLAEVSGTLGVFGQDPEAFLRRRREKLCAVRRIEPADVERRLGERTAARQAKDFARADAIRKELAARGVEVMDGPSGSTWRVAEE